MCSVHSLQPALGPSLDFTPLDFSELDSVLQQQERIMSVSQKLASEASRKSKLVAGLCSRGRTCLYTHTPTFILKRVHSDIVLHLKWAAGMI